MATMRRKQLTKILKIVIAINLYPEKSINQKQIP
jgi:hypothetical protein